jgi:hypothetical protein
MAARAVVLTLATAILGLGRARRGARLRFVTCSRRRSVPVVHLAWSITSTMSRTMAAASLTVAGTCPGSKTVL